MLFSWDFVNDWEYEPRTTDACQGRILVSISIRLSSYYILLPPFPNICHPLIQFCIKEWQIFKDGVSIRTTGCGACIARKNHVDKLWIGMLHPYICTLVCGAPLLILKIQFPMLLLQIKDDEQIRDGDFFKALEKSSTKKEVRNY
jgi:hypothetical protein